MDFFTLYTILPFLSSILFLFFGTYVYLNNRKSIVNITFLFLCLATFWWQFSWFILFIIPNEALAKYLVKIGYVGIIFIPIFGFHFILSFLGRISKFDKYLLFSSYSTAIILEVVLLTTNYFINGFYKYFWGFYPRAGFLHPSYLLLLSVLVIRMLYLLFSSLKKKKIVAAIEYPQIKYILLGTIFYIFASVDFLVNYGVEFYPFGFLFILVFLGITTYAVIRHYLFGIKVLLTELSVGAMAILLLINTLVSTTYFDFFWKGIIFLLFLIFGYYLIKATHEESKRREEAEKIAIQEKFLRQRAEKLAKEFERLDRAKTQFVLATQHHLRTPLSIIKGYTSMILEGSYGKVEEKAKKALSGIQESIDRLIKLVNEFLDISQLQVGREILKKEETQIEKLIEEVVKELDPSAKEKGIYLKLEAVEKLPKMKLDRTKIKTAIFNVVDNGIKYTRKGGVIIKCQILNDKCQIIVKDTGIGLTKEEIKTLFTKFFERGKEAEKIYTTGRGIGLYIAKNIIETHQGKIWAESEGKSKGSTFYIELPLE